MKSAQPWGRILEESANPGVELRCRHCGALNPVSASACWICRRGDWKPELLDQDTRPYPPAPETPPTLPEPRREREPDAGTRRRHPEIIPPERRDPVPIDTRRLGRILLLITFFFFVMSLFRSSPTVAIILLVLFLPSLLRGLASQRATSATAVGGSLLKGIFVIGSLAIAFVVILVVLAVSVLFAVFNVFFGASNLWH